jgi:hypothetical protein
MLDINFHPTKKDLRGFGFAALVAFGLIGGLVYWKRGLFGFDFGGATETVSYVLWGLGLLSGFFSIALPAANRALYVALSVITYPIGFVVSHVVMAIIFFVIITPVGLLFRVLGRDPLHRKFDRSAESYWDPHVARKDKGSYFKQF